MSATLWTARIATLIGPIETPAFVSKTRINKKCVNRQEKLQGVPTD